MNLRFETQLTRKNESGQALAVALVTAGISMAILGGTMDWTATTSMLNDRNNDYFAALNAAEAATERMLSEILQDYQQGGASLVDSKLSTYRQRRPLAEEHPFWARYAFEDINGTSQRTTLEMTSPWTAGVPLVSQYDGLNGYAAGFSVIATARDTESLHNNVVGVVQQDFQLATIPLFQFAIFYNMDMEIHPGPKMVVGGRVHSNYDLYSDPRNTLVFEDDVTASGQIYTERMPGDPGGAGSGTLEFKGEHDAGVSTLNLPMGLENTPENARAIIEVPPAGESTTSELGQQRLYNKADLVVMVGDDGPDADSDPDIQTFGHRADGSVFAMTPSEVSSFVDTTNATFFNKREGKTVVATEIDVGAFKAWNGSGNPLKSVLGRDVSSVYVADVRSQQPDTQAGVRIVNGQTLPNGGLTVVTPEPLYVKGNYNVPSSALGTHDTSGSQPAAFIADAITVLSSAWDDSRSTQSLSSRTAASTTVNAAFLAGIVPTTQGSYSGGVENYPRFLEDWKHKTLTYNGSMVVMFPSAIATAPWRGTGSTYGIYNPPGRDWYFDKNFLDPTKLPPITPQARTVIRGRYGVIAEGRYAGGSVAALGGQN